MTILQKSPQHSFRVVQLFESVAIGEAVGGDLHGWRNGTHSKLAFMVYLGCRQEEVSGYIETFNTFSRWPWCEVHQPKHLKGFEVEIKIREMQRYSDSNALGLDYLIESESAKNFGGNSEEYNYYTTGYMPQ